MITEASPTWGDTKAMPMNEIKKCPLCGYEPISTTTDGTLNQVIYVNCDRCGRCGVTDEFISYTTPEELKKFGHILSGISRELSEHNDKQPLFKYEDIKNGLESYLVPPIDDIEAKSIKLLNAIKRRTKFFGDIVDIHRNIDYPLAYAQNDQELWAIIDLLADWGYLQKKSADTRSSYVILTAAGLKSLTTVGQSHGNKGFVAIWFHEKMGAATKAIEDAILESGYRPMCIKDEHFPDRIMDKALGEIRDSKFLVVDLTGGRGSVFFEAGFAMGLNKDIIYIYNSEDESVSALEFYTKHYQCYPYKTSDELKEKLMDIIKARIVQTD